VEQGRGLAASLAPLSSLGSATARRIARLESADGTADSPPSAMHA